MRFLMIVWSTCVAALLTCEAAEWPRDYFWEDDFTEEEALASTFRRPGDTSDHLASPHEHTIDLLTVDDTTDDTDSASSFEPLEASTLLDDTAYKRWAFKDDNEDNDVGVQNSETVTQRASYPGRFAEDAGVTAVAADGSCSSVHHCEGSPQTEMAASGGDVTSATQRPEPLVYPLDYTSSVSSSDTDEEQDEDGVELDREARVSLRGAWITRHRPRKVNYYILLRDRTGESPDDFLEDSQTGEILEAHSISPGSASSPVEDGQDSSPSSPVLHSSEAHSSTKEGVGESGMEAESGGPGDVDERTFGSNMQQEEVDATLQTRSLQNEPSPQHGTGSNTISPNGGPTDGSHNESRVSQPVLSRPIPALRKSLLRPVGAVPPKPPRPNRSKSGRSVTEGTSPQTASSTTLEEDEPESNAVAESGRPGNIDERTFGSDMQGEEVDVTGQTRSWQNEPSPQHGTGSNTISPNGGPTDGCHNESRVSQRVLSRPIPALRKSLLRPVGAVPPKPPRPNRSKSGRSVTEGTSPQTASSTTLEEDEPESNAVAESGRPGNVDERTFGSDMQGEEVDATGQTRSLQKEPSPQHGTGSSTISPNGGPTDGSHNESRVSQRVLSRPIPALRKSLLRPVGAVPPKPPRPNRSKSGRNVTEGTSPQTASSTTLEEDEPESNAVAESGRSGNIDERTFGSDMQVEGVDATGQTRSLQNEPSPQHGTGSNTISPNGGPTDGSHNESRVSHRVLSRPIPALRKSLLRPVGAVPPKPPRPIRSKSGRSVTEGTSPQTASSTTLDEDEPESNAVAESGRPGNVDERTFGSDMQGEEVDATGQTRSFQSEPSPQHGTGSSTISPNGGPTDGSHNESRVSQRVVSRPIPALRKSLLRPVGAVPPKPPRPNRSKSGRSVTEGTSPQTASSTTLEEDEPESNAVAESGRPGNIDERTFGSDMQGEEVDATGQTRSFQSEPSPQHGTGSNTISPKGGPTDGSHNESRVSQRVLSRSIPALRKSLLRPVGAVPPKPPRPNRSKSGRSVTEGTSPQTASSTTLEEDEPESNAVAESGRPENIDERTFGSDMQGEEVDATGQTRSLQNEPLPQHGTGSNTISPKGGQTDGSHNESRVSQRVLSRPIPALRKSLLRPVGAVPPKPPRPNRPKSEKMVTESTLHSTGANVGPLFDRGDIYKGAAFPAAAAVLHPEGQVGCSDASTQTDPCEMTGHVSK